MRRLPLSIVAFAMALVFVGAGMHNVIAQDTASNTTPSLNDWFALDFEDVEFTPTPFGETATLVGDPMTGAYSGLNRFPVGQVIPTHTHSNAGQVVVIRGVLFNYRPGEPKLPYGPGSFLSEPSGVVHTTECSPESPEPCLVFVTQDDFLDFNVVNEHGTPVASPAAESTIESERLAVIRGSLAA